MLSLDRAPEKILHRWESKSMALKRNPFLYINMLSTVNRCKVIFDLWLWGSCQLNAQQGWFIASWGVIPGDRLFSSTKFFILSVQVLLLRKGTLSQIILAPNAGINLIGTSLLCHLLSLESKKTNIPHLNCMPKFQQLSHSTHTELLESSGLHLWECGNAATESH